MLNIILFIYNARIAYGKYVEPKYQYHVDCKIVTGTSGARFGEFSTWIWGGVKQGTKQFGLSFTHGAARTLSLRKCSSRKILV
jgi:hypothetical protein